MHELFWQVSIFGFTSVLRIYFHVDIQKKPLKLELKDLALKYEYLLLNKVSMSVGKFSSCTEEILMNCKPMMCYANTFASLLYGPLVEIML